MLNLLKILKELIKKSTNLTKRIPVVLGILNALDMIIFVLIVVI
jgi:hypothetical protein